MAKQNDLSCFNKRYLIIPVVLIGLYLLFKNDDEDEDCNCNK